MRDYHRLLALNKELVITQEQLKEAEIIDTFLSLLDKKPALWEK